MLFNRLFHLRRTPTTTALQFFERLQEPLYFNGLQCTLNSFPCHTSSVFSHKLRLNRFRSFSFRFANCGYVTSTCSISAAAKMPVSTTEKVEVESSTSSSSTKLYFVKLTEHASTPTKGSKFAAGYDLKSAYDAVVPKRGSCLIKTDIQIQLPAGTYGRIAPRSGLALKNKIDVGAGVIDEDYRGNIGVILFNHSDEDFTVSKGDRIAQLICEKICYPEAVEVKSLEESERGESGFGSTGVKKMKTSENESVTVQN